MLRSLCAAHGRGQDGAGWSHGAGIEFATSMKMSREVSMARRVRYAVVGLGYITQSAVLPAFAHARRNSELGALFSSDATKLRRLGRKYGVGHLYGYEDDDYERGLQESGVDAVYIALPNDRHREYTQRAAALGVHVLCEKPMALSVGDCEAMIEAAQRNRVKLMVAYRLHFQRANLSAVETIRKGRLGDPRVFESVFTMDVKDRDNIRLKRERGGGTLWDIGIYCINAARYLFREEPQEAFAWTASRGDLRFREVEEMTSALLRFPNDRLAGFTVSFGASDAGTYRVVGTKGDLRLDSAYEYAEKMTMTVTIGSKKKTTKTFPKTDQFAPELLHFSDCILTGKEPRPSGREGLADVRVIEALYRSAKKGSPVSLDGFRPASRPGRDQVIERPGIEEPELVKATPPSGKS
jgi:predicted dehydrogenase